MSDADAIADDEIILKRISPGSDSIKQSGSSALRATSFAIKPRPDEEYPSWSRQSITSAERLLEIEGAKGRDISGWCVAAVSVEAVRRLGLDVEVAPTEEDPGHCHIVPTDRQHFSGKIWSKLAKETRIVYTVPDESGQSPRGWVPQ